MSAAAHLFLHASIRCSGFNEISSAIESFDDSHLTHLDGLPSLHPRIPRCTAAQIARSRVRHVAAVSPEFGGDFDALARRGERGRRNPGTAHHPAEPRAA